MKLFMNSTVYVTMILICCVIWVACSFPVAMSCDSCGRECANACGTRHFRTCCFNYLKRKRSVLPPLKYPDETNADFRDLWWAKIQVEKTARDNLLNSADFYGSDFQPTFLFRPRDDTPQSFGTHDGHSAEQLAIAHKGKILEEVEGNSGQQSRGLYEAA
ncbi:uncharacterized protein LOC129786537 [Lutzomyia longipalpis]|uniref:uncharacterized protein LOC129786537 n=1 Tax=Lutzomyia longipalpis TaxID=7200 RepID=UPI0024838F83|nr:uncharacterized protein LOC129786537 [Lutzomyia longipalpis]